MSPDAVALISILTPIGGLVGWAIRELFKAHLRRSEAEHELRVQHSQSEHAAHMNLVQQAIDALEKSREDAAASGMMKAVILEKIERINARLGIVEQGDTISTLGGISKSSDPDLTAKLPTDKRRRLTAAQADQVLDQVDGNYRMVRKPPR